MIEAKVLSIHYKKLNPVCAYKDIKGILCGGKVEIIRISVLTNGDLHVSTMCLEHSKGERKHALNEGMVMAGETSIVGAYSDAVLVNPVVAEEMERLALGVLEEHENAED